MRMEARIFIIVSTFLVVACIGYGWWTWAYEPRGLEPVGTVGLILSAGLCGIIGSYFSFVARRIDARPEDLPDAEIADGAGDLGFFSPGSYWPIALAGAATVTGLAAAFWQVWLLIIGVAFLLLAVGGLLFEYYVGQNEAETTASHTSLER
jgi:cytochrome c oxidase subunit IV